MGPSLAKSFPICGEEAPYGAISLGSPIGSGQGGPLERPTIAELTYQSGPLVGPSLAKSFVICDEEAPYGAISFGIANLDCDKEVHLRNQPLRNQHIKVVHSWEHRLRNHL